MKKSNVLKWIILLIFTLLYISLKYFKLLPDSVLSVISILMFIVIIYMPLEHKIYCLFFFMQFYLYIFIFGFAFYNVITLSILMQLILKKNKLNIKAISVAVFLLVYEIFAYLIVGNSTSISYLIKWVLSIFLAIDLMYDNTIKIRKLPAILFLCLGSIIMEVAVILNSLTIENAAIQSLSGALSTLDKNTFSLYCLLTATCSTYVFLDKKIQEEKLFIKYKKYLIPFLTVCAIISLYAGALMTSKTYFLLLIIWAILLLAFNIQYIKRMKILFSLLILVIITILVVPQTKTLLITTLNRFGDLSNINEITTGRFEIYASYINGLLNHPLQCFFGTGLFSYINFYNINVISITGEAMITHNIILEIICGYGLIGFILLLSIYLDIFSPNFNFKLNKDYNRLIPLLVFLCFSQTIAIFREDITQFIILLCFLIMKENAYPENNIQGEKSMSSYIGANVAI